METFDAKTEVEWIRTRRAEARRKLYRKSRLDRYRAELVAMKRAGASCADLVEWLRVNHRLKIHRSSIDRYLRKLPELNTMIVETGQEDISLSEEEV
jgi:IS30 family transposase